MQRQYWDIKIKVKNKKYTYKTSKIIKNVVKYKSVKLVLKIWKGNT